MARYPVEFEQRISDLVIRNKIEEAIEAVAVMAESLWGKDKWFPAIYPDDVRAVSTATPEVLRGSDQKSLAVLRLASLMAFLGFGKPYSRWMPYGTRIGRFTGEDAVQAVISYVQNSRNIRTWVKSGLVLQIKIQNSNVGPCESCKSISGTWALGSQPELPYKQCTNSYGCHCMYVASKFKENAL